MIIIMLGAQGTGKGTVAGLLSDELNIPQISTGDVFRKNIKDQTELGVEANKYISKGQLVPDEITIPMVINEIDSEKAKNGAILDGFPRTIEQAQKLKDILDERNKKIDLVINLTSPRDEIITRIVDRRVCPNCKATFNLKLHPPIKEGICDNCGHELKQREDDMDEQSIKNRLEIYDKQTSPLVEYYKNEGVLRTEEISQRINRFGKEVATDVVNDIKKEGKN